MSKLKDILSNEAKFNEVAAVSFKTVDVDQSGFIDYSELYKALQKIYSDLEADPPTEKDAKEMMKHLDVDKSGKIDFNEFKVLLRDVFKAMDE